MPQETETSLVALDVHLPRCTAHPQHISYRRCRRCNEPTCPACRVDSSLGMICRRCAMELRDQDSTAVAALHWTATGSVALVILLLAIAQELSPGLARHLAFAPFATMVEPWRLVTGLVTFIGASPLVASLPSLISLLLAGITVESLRGPTALLSTALTSGIAGFAALYLTTTSTSPQWLDAAQTPLAAVAGLAVAGVSASIQLQRHAGLALSTAAAAILALGLATVSPVSWIQILGGVLAAVLAEVVRAFFRQPQRSVLVLAVSQSVAFGAVVAAVAIRALVG